MTSKKASKVTLVRIVPKYGRYVIELVYTVPDVALKKNNGRPIKNINPFYNKELARLQSELRNNPITIAEKEEQTGVMEQIKKKKYSSRRIERLTFKRHSKLEDYFHKSTTDFANYLASNRINELSIGKNNNWKQGVKIGKRNNQNFVTIPFNKCIQMLDYKCALRGIRVKIIAESDTSKCSFLDRKSIGKQIFYKGKRKGKWFKSKKYGFIHADVNAAYNIGRQCNPKFISEDGVEALPLVPYKYRVAYKSR